MSAVRGRRKTQYRFSDLDPEHQDEAVRNLGRRVAEKTAWKFEPRFPTEEAAAVAADVSVVIHDSRVRHVMLSLEAGGKIRPILIDEIDEGGPWMEGIHRAVAAMELGLRTVPAFLRIE